MDPLKFAFTVVVIFLAFATGATGAVVDPNASNGIAAVVDWYPLYPNDPFTGGGPWVLCVDGRVFYYSHTIGGWQEIDLSPPIPVTEIRDWSPFWVFSSQGYCWRWEEGNWMQTDVMVLDCTRDLPVESQNLGSIKSQFR